MQYVQIKFSSIFLDRQHTLQQIKTQSAGKLPGNLIKGILKKITSGLFQGNG
jgi:hypothetical protein